jgi:CheY-like chemotaxis protein
MSSMSSERSRDPPPEDAERTKGTAISVHAGSGPLAAPASQAGILVVEDDDDIRDSLARVLAVEGYRVEVAANGHDAMALLARIALPSVAIIDLRMPIMDGAELIQAMRANPRYGSIRIVALSAASTVAIPDDVAVLKKPVSISDLLSAIGGHEHGGS